MRATARFLFCTLGLLLGGSALAQATFTWTGAAGPLQFQQWDFHAPANWQGNAVPTNGSHLLFGPGPSASVLLGSNFTSGNITFNGIQNGYYLGSSNGSVLTLGGDVTTSANSTYWGLFELPVVLAAGNHVYTANGAAIYHFNSISGSGGIIKNGSSNLYLTESSTYTGDTTINTGYAYVGDDYAFGFGTVTLQNGTTLATAYTEGTSSITLGNDFLLGANVMFNTTPFFEDEPESSLVLGNRDNTTIAPISGVTTVNLTHAGANALELASGLRDGDSSTTYTFTSTPGSGGFILSGANSNYSGDTVINGNTSVTFQTLGSLPSGGSISTDSTSYAGYGDVENPAAAGIFFSLLHQDDFAGTIGFDEGGTYSTNIDLSGFTQSESVALGTRTIATFTGAITPASGPGGHYNFRSSGILYLGGANALSGSHAVTSRTLANAETPGMVVLNHSVSNTYSGGTLADGAAVIFDGAGSLPATGGLQLWNGGYISATDTSGVSLATLVSRVTVQGGTPGVLGIDYHGAIHSAMVGNQIYSTPIDFSSLTEPVYLGTTLSTNRGTVTVTGAITTHQGGSGDYYLTGYRYGTLKVESALTGNRALHVGVQGDQEYSGTVELVGTSNTYTGGTVLHSGGLTIGSPGVLGSGALTADPGSERYVNLSIPEDSTLTNNITLQSGRLLVSGNDSTLSGTISGTGSLHANGSLTVTGSNTYSGGTEVHSDTLVAASNTALGTGGVDLSNGGTVVFTSAAPVIGSLLDADIQNDEGGFLAPSLVLDRVGGGTLTINQSHDAYFDGIIAQNGGVASLVKNGAGTLTITGAVEEDNQYTTPYSGGTTINAGRLVAGSANALGTGTITLNGGQVGAMNGVTLANPIAFGANGGRLGGSGIIGTPITAGTNVVIAPGESPGTLTFSAGLTLASGGTLDFEIQSATGAAGTGYDLVSISSGALVVASTSAQPFTIRLITLNGSGSQGLLADFNPANAYSWLVYRGNAGGGISGFQADKFLLDAALFANGANGLFSLTQGMDGADPALYLTFTPVPEPSTYALLAAGLGALTWQQYRRRRRG